MSVLYDHEYMHVYISLCVEDSGQDHSQTCVYADKTIPKRVCMCVRVCVCVCVCVYRENNKIKFGNGLVRCLPRTD